MQAGATTNRGHLQDIGGRGAQRPEQGPHAVSVREDRPGLLDRAARLAIEGRIPFRRGGPPRW